MTTTDTPRTDAAYKAEVERLKAESEVEFWKAKAYEAEASEGKHEAEVERLRELLSLEKNAHEGTKKICDKILDSTRKTPSRAWHRAHKKIPLK